MFKNRRAYDIKTCLVGSGICLVARSFASVQEGVEAARAKKTAEVFLGGSFFVVAEFVK